MIRTASLQDLEALRALFARANDAPYDLAKVAGEKCFGPGVSGEPVVRVEKHESRAIGAVVTCGKWIRLLVVERERRREGLGTALLLDAESRGVTGIAAEAGNYFTPGITSTDEGLAAFLQARGYSPAASTWNLETGLPSSPPGLAPGVRRPDAREAAAVLDFVGREFGKIWRFEAARAFATAIPQIFISEDEGRITGFAAHDVTNRGLGFFGPTGVLSSHRGRGLGSALLHASLADLGRLGYSRAVIPWTDALEFYRKSCGAIPAHRFTTYTR